MGGSFELTHGLTGMFLKSGTASRYPLMRARSK
jgi:hypothetical protein